jgi:hypothetical protein
MVTTDKGNVIALNGLDGYCLPQLVDRFEYRKDNPSKSFFWVNLIWYLSLFELICFSIFVNHLIANKDDKKRFSTQFHIPVMGLAYTIDSYTCGTVWNFIGNFNRWWWIDRKMRFLQSKFKHPYQEITQKTDDYRAKKSPLFRPSWHYCKRKFEHFKLELAENKTS